MDKRFSVTPEEAKGIATVIDFVKPTMKHYRILGMETSRETHAIKAASNAERISHLKNRLSCELDGEKLRQRYAEYKKAKADKSQQANQEEQQNDDLTIDERNDIKEKNTSTTTTVNDNNNNDDNDDNDGETSSTDGEPSSAFEQFFQMITNDKHNPLNKESDSMVDQKDTTDVKEVKETKETIAEKTDDEESVITDVFAKSMKDLEKCETTNEADFYRIVKNIQIEIQKRMAGIKVSIPGTSTILQHMAMTCGGASKKCGICLANVSSNEYSPILLMIKSCIAKIRDHDKYGKIANPAYNPNQAVLKSRNRKKLSKAQRVKAKIPSHIFLTTDVLQYHLKDENVVKASPIKSLEQYATNLAAINPPKSFSSKICGVTTDIVGLVERLKIHWPSKSTDVIPSFCKSWVEFMDREFLAKFGDESEKARDLGHKYSTFFEKCVRAPHYINAPMPREHGVLLLPVPQALQILKKFDDVEIGYKRNGKIVKIGIDKSNGIEVNKRRKVNTSYVPHIGDLVESSSSGYWVSLPFVFN
eukprot:TRINITY_DN119_c0_g2_i2.p1 TRINITY_DN119_c0_g2~~TRINITY_DN119_c0_g2_i2.p1  ORF type:complete len:593 (+),score=202.23 TRINITY_DN119_c0_g2_i2:186-1781(+)